MQIRYSGAESELIETRQGLQKFSENKSMPDKKYYGIKHV